MKTRRVVRVAAVALLIGFALSSCQLHGKPKVARRAEARWPVPQADASPARAAVMSDTTTHTKVVAPGIVEPWGAQVDLSTREPGWIASLDVREGDVVSAGQLLATLDDRAQRQALDLARAELAEAEALLDRTEHGATPEEVKQATAELAAAVARRDFAGAAASRATRLRASGAIPEVEYDRASSEAATQAALAQRAEGRLQELTRGSRSEDRRAARARADAARARLRLAEAALDRRTVTAPRAGTILLSRFHVGEYYSPGSGPLLMLGDMTRLQVRLEVDEIDAHDVHVGAPCSLYSDGQTLLAQGTVNRLAPRMGRRVLPLESPTARNDVRVREVFVEVPNTASLIPGQRVWGHTPRVWRLST